MKLPYQHSMTVAAHRGDSYCCFENTMEAFAAAFGSRFLQHPEAEQGGALETVTPSAVAADPSEAPAPPIPQEVKKAVGVAAGEILRYLWDRFTYRWEQWMDNLRERREEREKAKEEKQELLEQEQSEQTDLPAAEQSVADSSPQVQAAAQTLVEKQLLRRSVVAFDSGQRSYKASQLKQTEDPSLNQPIINSNDKAYTDDAKAFCR